MTSLARNSPLELLCKKTILENAQNLKKHSYARVVFLGLHNFTKKDLHALDLFLSLLIDSQFLLKSFMRSY